MSTPTARMKRFGPGALRTRANVLTMARLLFAIPTLFLIEERGATWLTVSLWFVLSCTDGLDGWVARRDGTTRSGAFLDPLADKCLVIGAFVVLASRGDVSWIPVVLIAGREVLISVYRTVAVRRGMSIPARPLGKAKTFAQLLAVGAIVLPPTADATGLQTTIVWIAVALALISAVDLVVKSRTSAPS